MKIYNHGSHGRGTLIVAPGKDHPENSAWVKRARDANGRETCEPLQFVVKFQNGVAEVDEGLGRYLIDKKLARRSPLIVREGALAQAIERREPQPVGRPLEQFLGRA